MFVSVYSLSLYCLREILFKRAAAVQNAIDTQSFTCEPMLSYDIEYDEDLKDSVCELTKYHSQNLYNNSIELMNNKKMLNRIIRKTKD